jgi:hypothetical protein
MTDRNTETGMTSAGSAVSFAPIAAIAAAFPLGSLSGALVRYVWPEPYAPFLVFGAILSMVFIGLEIIRWNRPIPRRSIYLIAIGVYFAAVTPLADALRDLILGEAGKSSAERFAVTTMSVAIVLGAGGLLLRASFTREEERAIWWPFRRDLPGSSRVVSGEGGS